MKACKEEVEWRAWEEAEWMAWEEVERRAEVERCKAEEQAKKRISGLWLVMMELTVVGGGGCRTTVQQRQGEGVGAARVQPVHEAWARV